MRMKSTLLALALVAGCGDGGGTTLDLSPNPNPDMAGGGNTDMPGGGATIEVNGEIMGNTTWTKNNIYVLTSHVFVMSGTLTIEAGTTVRGRVGSSLVITRDAKINAVGTASEPIVFTSDKAPGTRKAKDWGGVVLLGKASINVASEFLIEGFPPTETRVKYGVPTGQTPDDAHDCGKIKYARIEFAGFEIAPTKEINSLTVGGCGSATELDFIQTHLGADDGAEFFGGTANIKHLVVTQANDDGLDWDFGWRGKVQFLVVQQSKANGNSAYESDGNVSAPTAMPYSNPTIYNVTLVGSGPGAAADTQLAMTLRRGTRGSMYNHIVMNFTNNVIDIAGADSTAAAKAGTLFVKNSIIFGNVNQDAMVMCVLDKTAPGTMTQVASWGGCDDVKGEPSADKSESPLVAGVQTADCANAATPKNCSDGSVGLVESDFFRGQGGHPATGNRFVDPQLENPSDLKAPNFKPKAGSPALTGGMAPTDPFFDANATFVGAIGSDDWTAGWTAYPEN
jgi:hypothetical protein